MFETASENGFRCSLCRPQVNVGSDAFNVLVCDNVTMNKCALEVLHLRSGGALFRYPSSADSVYDFPSYFFAPKSHSFEGEAFRFSSFSMLLNFLKFNSTCDNGSDQVGSKYELALKIICEC